MRVVLQRVRSAQLQMAGVEHAAIGPGLVLLMGFGPADTADLLRAACERLLHYRVFADAQGRTNLSLLQAQGSVLLVPNFTLYADTRSGRRPSFAGAAAPEQAASLFTQWVEIWRQQPLTVASGVFGADMQITLCADGPMTLILEFPLSRSAAESDA